LRGAMQREATALQPCPLTSTATAKHAALRVEARDRKRLEQLSRCITRPALSNERVQLNAAGQVEPKLKTPWRHSTTRLAMSLIEFMQRLAALVQWPQLHPPMTALRLSIQAVGCPNWVVGGSSLSRSRCLESVSHVGLA